MLGISCSMGEARATRVLPKARLMELANCMINAIYVLLILTDLKIMPYNRGATGRVLCLFSAN